MLRAGDVEIMLLIIKQKYIQMNDGVVEACSMDCRPATHLEDIWVFRHIPGQDG